MLAACRPRWAWTQAGGGACVRPAAAYNGRGRARARCAAPEQRPPEFRELYPHVTLFADNAIAFRRGDPVRFRAYVEHLLRAGGLGAAEVAVEA